VPGFDVGTWESIQAPAGTPPEVVTRLNTALREVTATNDIRAKMVALGFESEGARSPAETAQFIRNERNKFAKLVKERNIKAE
jgi:tripartite-type tricarboxylate transporter receptor subunit TctC